MQKGIVHLVLPIILIVIALVAVGGYAIVKNSSKQEVEVTGQPENQEPESAVNSNGETQEQITPTPTKKVTATQTPKPTSTPTQQSQQTVSKATCYINVTPDAGNPNAVKLAYGLTNNGVNATMTGAQWDFDGNGSWDTDMSLSNGSPTHTYSNGSHMVKLQLSLSNGEKTGVCSTTVNVPAGISVSLSGRVFSDRNCNNVWDTDEQFVSGITVNLFRQPGNNVFQTLTTDSGGNFSYSTIIGSSENLSLTPSALGTLTPPYYKIFYNTPNITLNSGNRNPSLTISVVPAENVGSCPI